MSKVGELGIHEVGGYYIHSKYIRHRLLVFNTFFMTTSNLGGGGGFSPPPPLSKSGGAQAPPASPGSLPLILIPFCIKVSDLSVSHCTMLSQYSVPTVTQSNSQTDVAAAVTGGVVTVVLIITTAVTVVVIVVLLLRNRRGHYSPGIQRLYVIIKSWRSLYVCFSCTGVK